MPRRAARPYPLKSVEQATTIAQGIRDHNAARPMNRLLLAQAIGRRPSSSEFRELVTASFRFGFTNGNYSSETIELTDLGEQLTTPRSDKERLDALRQGFRRVPLFDQLLTHFNNEKLPVAEFLKNTLEREPFSVDADWSDEAASQFTASGKTVGFIRDIGGSPYVVLEAGPPVAGIATEPEIGSPPDDVESSDDRTVRNGVESREEAPDQQVRLKEERKRTTEEEPSQLQFFIAHGRDPIALQQAKAILDELGIPYVVAVDEPNSGRPISVKVKNLMDACSAGIFIFTADEELKDKDGNVIYRPRENVIYELGAASYRYGHRIVIFKERDVSFPSDFSDLGYIEFEKGQLQGKSMELLRELIALKAVRLLPGA